MKGHNQVLSTKNYIITICCLLIAGLLWYHSVSLSHYRDIQKQWQSYSHIESQIITAEEDLLSSLGYGGLIHDFKNYVIRGDDTYRIKLESMFDSVESDLDTLKKNISSTEDEILFQNIERTIYEYRSNVNVVKNLHQINTPADVIDKKVKVNDDNAIASLITLRNRIIERSREVQESTELSMSAAEKYHSFGILIVIPIIFSAFLLIRLTNKINQSNATIRRSMRLVDDILDASPDPTVIVNSSGIITRTNNQISKLLGYQQHELVGELIEILIPKKLKESHQKMRERFFTNPKNINVSNRPDLIAQKKDGSIIDTEINISSVESAGEKFAIATLRDITKRKETEQKIHHQANYDTLTDLPNRLLSIDRLKQKLLDSKRTKKIVAVMFLDLDDFKKVNDTLGHEAGDKLLIDFSHRLQKSVRGGDTIARLGGDEFLIILDGLGTPEDSLQVSNNILKSCRQPFIANGRSLLMTVSIGIACHPKDGINSSELLRHADAAMYHAKAEGRNQCVFYTDNMNKIVSRRLAIDESLQFALERGEFDVFYQPKIDIKTGKISGLEALIRWNSPSLGFVPPDEFIPIAEGSGQIITIGNYVLNKSLDLIKKLRDKGYENIHIAVNFSPVQFRDRGLITTIKESLEKRNLQSNVLEVEVTEGVLISSIEQVKKTLNDIKSMGAQIAMDDFGTGYSSLSYLREYPFDILKIDKSFVQDITDDNMDKELIKGSISLAHSMGMKVVAEGVETKEQVNILTNVYCDIIQGYYYSKPLPEEELKKYLDTNFKISVSDN